MVGVTVPMVPCDSSDRVTLRLVKGLLPTFFMVMVKTVCPSVSLMSDDVWTLSWPVALRVFAVLKKML